MPPQHARQEGEGRSPFGCICGSTFSRLYVLQRHIASLNKVAKASCLLCENDKDPKAFSRLDHLYQHLRTFHKIPAGRIPNDLAAFFGWDSTAEEVTPQPPKPLASFSCPVLGCVKTGEFAYLRKVDLDEHMFYMHGWLQNEISPHQGVPNPAVAWVNNAFHQDSDWLPVSLFGQYTQQGEASQPQSTGNYFHANGTYLVNNNFSGGHLNIEQNEDVHGFRNQF